MKRYCCVLMVMLFLTSCASRLPSGTPLFQQYSQYTQLRAIEPLAQVVPMYFSAHVIEKSKQVSKETASQYIFLKPLQEVVSHFEKKNRGFACLTVNGFNANNEPLIQSMLFIKENNEWQIDHVGLIFPMNASKFTKKARCPDEFGPDYFFGKPKQ